MRHPRGPISFSNSQRVPFHLGHFTQPRGGGTRHFGPWYPRLGTNCTIRFGPPVPLNHVFTPSADPRLSRTNVPILRPVPNRPRMPYPHIERKHLFARTRFRNRRRRAVTEGKVTLNPSDPLNLQDLMKETERRRVEGLSPLRGDSRMNTPAVSVAGGESPLNNSLTPGSVKSSDLPIQSHTKLEFAKATTQRIFREKSKSLGKHQSLEFRAFGYIPVTGNYRNYYRRRDPKDRIPYLMPEWFAGKDVADYGCHNGTLTFSVLERFPDVRRIDAFDCDAELIANARSMQRERCRWDTGSNIRYDKINFQVANWIDNGNRVDEPEYDTIMAFSVTKWIHLNHGDSGLMRFLRRAFNLLKPGGHLLLEPQPKSSYRKTRFTAKHRAVYQSLKIDPSKLEPLLADLGFSYFDTIKAPRPHEPFKRKIILCSKSYGATPASIRNGFRSEVQHWDDGFHSPNSQNRLGPPPVCYHPQTPVYNLGTPGAIDSPANFSRQSCVSSSTATTSPMPITSPQQTHDTAVTCEPDSTSMP